MADGGGDRVKAEVLERGPPLFLSVNRIRVVSPCVITEVQVTEATAFYDEVLSLDLLKTVRVGRN